MNEMLYLIVSLAGQRAALPTATVESVVEVDAITAVPRVAPHVAGLFALRSRVLTVIDSAAALGMAPTRRGDAVAIAAIVLVDGHPYALLVDEVHDVVSAEPPAPVPALLQGGWAAAAMGAIEVDGEALLLLDPGRLVAGPPAMAA